MLNSHTPQAHTREQGVSRIEILLTHYDHGPVWVSVWDEATWWMGSRQWTVTGNEELGTFDDGDFEERPDQIDEMLEQAARPFDEREDTHSAVRCDPRAFMRSG